MLQPKKLNEFHSRLPLWATDQHHAPELCKGLRYVPFARPKKWTDDAVDNLCRAVCEMYQQIVAADTWLNEALARNSEAFKEWKQADVLLSKIKTRHAEVIEQTRRELKTRYAAQEILPLKPASKGERKRPKGSRKGAPHTSAIINQVEHDLAYILTFGTDAKEAEVAQSVVNYLKEYNYPKTTWRSIYNRLRDRWHDAW